jgi:hypothetical protein
MSALREEKARSISSSRSMVTPWEDRRTELVKEGPQRVGRIFFLEGYLVGNTVILDGRRPEGDVVEQPTTARKVALKAVNMAFIDKATDSGIDPIENGDGDGQSP